MSKFVNKIDQNTPASIFAVAMKYCSDAIMTIRCFMYVIYNYHTIVIISHEYKESFQQPTLF